MGKATVTTPAEWRRDKRLAAGLSQSQLARKMGVTENTIQAWEKPKGGSEPSAGHFMHFCEAVGADPREAPYTWTIPG